VAEAEIAVIGGSGLYDMEGLRDVETIRIATPFGDPSDEVTIGDLSGRRVAFLPRHGRGHRISPSELNQRANIWALKSLGVQSVLSVSAVGSLRQELKPLDLVIPDQLVDRTRHRVDTFFTDGIVAHVGMAEPFCPDLRARLYEHGRAAGSSIHDKGTLVVIEGPQFSTRAESSLYRSWGMDIIGMTALPEARLAREAELCYATIACVTDYDVWHVGAGDVTVDMVIQNLLRNTTVSREIIRRVVPTIPDSPPCGCRSALRHAIMTAPARIPPLTRDRVDLLVGKYLPKA